MKIPGAGWRVWGGALTICLIGFAVVWPLIPAPLPKRIRLGTGLSGGRYAAFGEALAGRLRGKGFEVEVVASQGSTENLQRLAAGELDVALVQGGVARSLPAPGVEGIASLFYEPIWIFHRQGEEIALVRDLKGKRIAVGLPGSGSSPLARTILAANGIREGLVSIGGADAFEALSKGEVDAVVIVQAPTAEWIHDLVEDGRFDLLVFQRAKAYAARFQHLEMLDVPRGFVDFERDLPSRDVQLLTTTANLAVREGIHPELIRLLIELCRDELAQGSMLASPGTFPSPAHVDLPLSPDAVHYYRTGPSWLYRYLHFQLAYALDRLSILLIPLLTLLFPLLKGAGPLYRWTVFRRIYPWYRVLHELDDAGRGAQSEEEKDEILRQLEELRRTVAGITVPARYAGELYTLRRHISLVAANVKTGPDSPAP